MLVVADTSALVALALCEGLPLLDALSETVRVPRAVYAECSVSGKPGAETLAGYLAGKVLDVELGRFVLAAPGLGRGELEAMALYRTLAADRLLLDDARARKVARLNGIQVIGSVGVLLAAKRRGLLTAIKPRLEALSRAGIHVSDALRAEALRLAGET